MAQNPDTPKMRLEDINLPARTSGWLTQCYAKQLGLQAQECFVMGVGTLLTFETGVPLDHRGPSHDGFRRSLRGQVHTWAKKIDASLTLGVTDGGVRMNDLEGNSFEMYWEETA